MVARITRILEKIFRSIAGESPMHIGLERIEAEVILRVWLIPVTYAYLETLVDPARDGDIHVLATHHGIGIGISPRMKDRICANVVRVEGIDFVAGKG